MQHQKSFAPKASRRRDKKQLHSKVASIFRFSFALLLKVMCKNCNMKCCVAKYYNAHKHKDIVLLLEQISWAIISIIAIKMFLFMLISYPFKMNLNVKYIFVDITKMLNFSKRFTLQLSASHLNFPNRWKHVYKTHWTKPIIISNYQEQTS